mgnify:CR=1 FL=1
MPFALYLILIVVAGRESIIVLCYRSITVIADYPSLIVAATILMPPSSCIVVVGTLEAAEAEEEKMKGAQRQMAAKQCTAMHHAINARQTEASPSTDRQDQSSRHFPAKKGLGWQEHYRTDRINHPLHPPSFHKAEKITKTIRCNIKQFDYNNYFPRERASLLLLTLHRYDIAL